MAGLSELSDSDLVGKVFQVERDLVKLRFRHSTNQLENTARLRSLRREIARLRTEARRRELEQDLPKDSLLAKHRGAGASASEEAAPAQQGGFLAGVVDKITGNE